MSSCDLFSTLQTIGSEELVGLAYFGVVKHYGWKQVTILQLDIDLFEAVRFCTSFKHCGMHLFDDVF